LLGLSGSVDIDMYGEPHPEEIGIEVNEWEERVFEVGFKVKI